MHADRRMEIVNLVSFTGLPWQSKSNSQGTSALLAAIQGCGILMELVPLVALSPSESLGAGVEVDVRINCLNAREPNLINLICSKLNDIELLSYIYQTRYRLRFERQRHHTFHTSFP